MLKFNPTVFAVGNTYQIMAAVDRESFCWVEVGGELYFDASNGIMRAEGNIHRVTLPQAALDTAGEYTLCLRPSENAKGSEQVERHDYKFSPVPEDNYRIYNISDAHSRVVEPIAAAKAFGKIDALVLCGDIMNVCNNISEYMKVYEICGEIAGGEIPVVSTRGNHDMRGALAYKFADYMPSADGRIFYTFRLGSIWGVVLDCGEITPDDDPNHNFAVCCDPLRHEQTEFLHAVAANGENEYAADGVKHRVVVVHDPFFERHNPPYDVTRDIFREWFDIIDENIKPDFWLCGHSHLCQVRRPPYSWDEFGIKTPLVMASTPGDRYFKGGGFDFAADSITLTFTDSDGAHDEPIKIK